jgi:hypothetical protein
MATPAQIAANQENAQKSTGPTTDEGKAASSRNNYRFGFNAKVFTVIECESQADYDQSLQELLDEHRPTAPTESILVEKMAQHHWIAMRAQRLQDSCFHENTLNDSRLALSLRYQTTHERLFHQAHNELRKLRAEKRKNEIGFESQKRKEAEESRRQSAHELKQTVQARKVWLAEHQVLEQTLRNEQFEIWEMRRSGAKTLALETEQTAQKARQAA